MFLYKCPEQDSNLESMTLCYLNFQSLINPLSHFLIIENIGYRFKQLQICHTKVGRSTSIDSCSIFNLIFVEQIRKNSPPLNNNCFLISIAICDQNLNFFWIISASKIFLFSFYEKVEKTFIAFNRQWEC